MAEAISPTFVGTPATEFKLTLPTLPLRPALRREGSSVRFEPPTTAQRPAFVHRATSDNVKLVSRSISFSYPPPTAPSPTTPQAASRRSEAHIFGMHTAYKPLWLLGMGSFGNFLYGTGTLAIERAIWPRRLIVPGPDGVIPAPFFSPLFGQKRFSFGLGAASTAGGVLLTAVASGLFYQDARRLARRQNSAVPSYTRANVYFGAHVTGIALSLANQFAKEGLRDAVSRDLTWVAALPGIVGSMLFSVTQAQAASNCEIYWGRMPFKHRAHISFAARFGVGIYTLWAAMMSSPGFSLYGREVVRLLAQTSTSVAFSLPLTTARLGRHGGVDFASHQPKPSWYAMNVLLLYIAGRTLAGFGPDMLQQGLFKLPTNAGYVFGGATALSIGTGLCSIALMSYKNDVAAYDPKRANVMVGLAFFALLAILAYVGIAQYAQTTREQKLIWVAVVPGIIGSGLRLAILPNLFAVAELRRGDSPVPYRYHFTEASRAIASTCFGLWGVMCALPNINSYAREAVAVSAGAFATLGMALPTTTSRRAMPQYAFPLSPGATPAGQIDGFTFADAFGQAADASRG